MRGKNGVGERAVSATLTDADHQAIADKLFEHMRPWLAPTAGGLVDAVTVAEALSVSVAYVYEHANELGAQRIGTGPKPRLRFDLAEARAAFGKRNERPVSAMADIATKPRRPKRRQPSEVPLLPVGRD
jgi:hypothetical protein